MILWKVIGIILQYELYLLFAGLVIISALYSSVGHGGASGYLTILSISSYGLMSHIWLKQHVWIMNLVVASIAFYHYNRAGYHIPKLTIPFIIASVPMAFIGGAMQIDAEIYDVLLSITLVWASYKILRINSEPSNYVAISRMESYAWGWNWFLQRYYWCWWRDFLITYITKKNKNVKTAAATAAVFIFVNSLSGLIGMGVSGQLDLDLDLLVLFIAAIAIGGFFGALIGSAYADNRVVRRLLCLVLLVAAAKRVAQLIIN